MKAIHIVITALLVGSVSSPAWSQCDCPGQADPNRNGISFEIGDLVLTYNRAFLGIDVVTTPTCVCEDGDADCNGVVDVLDVLRFMAVIAGDSGPESFCVPDPSCTVPPCSGPPVQATGGDVFVESKTVPAGATGVQIGIYVLNTSNLSAIILPLEIRSITPGSFITSTPTVAVQGRITASSLGSGFSIQGFYPAPSATNLCSGPLSHSFDTAEFNTPFVPSSPLGFLWGGIAVDRAQCLSPGFDGFPGNGTPTITLIFDVTSTPGTFEIDTCCVAPHNHLLFVDCDADTVILPRFTKGVITIGTAVPCACACAADPRCDGVHDIVDVVAVINAAFRGGNPTSDSGCPSTREDADCNGQVDILDVMRMVDVALRGADPASKFCDPCQ